MLSLFLAAAKNLNAPQIIAVVQLLICHVRICYCTNYKNKDSPEWVDIYEIFNEDDDFREYQDGHTDGEADDSSDSSEDELFEDDEIDND